MILLTQVYNCRFNAGDAVGANSTIEVQSQISINQSVFNDIRQAVIDAVPEGESRDLILDANENLSKANNKTSFLTAYDRLIQAAANHITVLGPFLPTLAAMLSSL
jgi:hypothetical protein